MMVPTRFRPTGRADDVGHLDELLLGAAGNPGHHRRCVPVIVSLEELEGAPWILEVGSRARSRPGPAGSPRKSCRSGSPPRRTGEQPVLEPEIAADDERRVGVRPHVVGVVQVVGQDVPDQPAEDGDVGAGPDLEMLVGDRRRPCEARVDRNQRGAVLVTRLERPLEATGMILGRVGAHHQDDIGVLDVLPVVGHRAPTERGGQTGPPWGCVIYGPGGRCRSAPWRASSW